MLSDDRYMSLRQLSQYSSLSQSTLRQLLTEIPHTRVKRKIIVKRSEFDSWVRRRRMQHERVSPFVENLLSKIVGRNERKGKRA
jgi:lambda repressor-like predicted transcriptional regulator